MMTLARVYAGAALPAKKKVRGAIWRSGSSRSQLYSMTTRERVQQLPLVLMDTLHLRIEDRVRI